MNRNMISKPNISIQDYKNKFCATCVHAVKSPSFDHHLGDKTYRCRRMPPVNQEYPIVHYNTPACFEYIAG